MADLLPKAEKFAQPAGSIAMAVLDEHEAIVRTRLQTARTAPSRSDVVAAQAEVKAERQKLADLEKQRYVLNDEIASLSAAQLKRKNSVWGRWFPNRTADEALNGLRVKRAALINEQKIGTRPLLEALAAESRAENALQEAQVRFRASDREAMATARIRLSAIARARSILKHWPSFAYAGVRTLLSVAGRLEKARDRTLDDVPSSKPSY